MTLAALALVLRILLKILAAKGRLVRAVESKVLIVALLVAPWVAWLAFIIAGVVVRRSLIRR